MVQTLAASRVETIDAQQQTGLLAVFTSKTEGGDRNSSIWINLEVLKAIISLSIYLDTTGNHFPSAFSRSIVSNLPSLKYVAFIPLL